jgi:hypothetical protein
MPKFEIRVCQCNTEKSNNLRKFSNYCRDILPKKNGTILQLTSSSLMIESDKQILFEILDELDKNSIPVITKKIARK